MRVQFLNGSDGSAETITGPFYSVFFREGALWAARLNHSPGEGMVTKLSSLIKQPAKPDGWLFNQVIWEQWSVLPDEEQV